MSKNGYRMIGVYYDLIIKICVRVGFTIFLSSQKLDINHYHKVVICFFYLYYKNARLTMNILIKKYKRILTGNCSANPKSIILWAKIIYFT
jgi:hypothetical protein